MRRILVLALLLSSGRAFATASPLVRADDPGVRSCEATPSPGWQQPAFDDAGWAHGVEPPGCQVLRLRRHFGVEDLARLGSVTLTMRYQDGFVAWINGVEVARRRLADGSALASEPHGAEAERLVVAAAAGPLRAGDNVLAVEVHPFRAGRAPAAEVALEGAEGVRILRGPYLTRVLEGEAHLAVETNVPSRVEVRYGPAGGAGPERTVASARPATRHVLWLAGLAPGRAWSYRVSASAPGLADAAVASSFHTPPSSSHPLRFVVTGDVRSGHEVHEQIARAIAGEDPDLVLMTGDLVATGSDEAEWQRFFDIEGPLLQRIPVYSAIGNHEYGRNSEGKSRFLELFERAPEATWSSFDVAGVHFILLDSEAYRDPAQLAWLKQDLADAQRRKPRALFACTHHGPWSAAVHGDSAEAIRDYVPLLEQARATLLFSGHDHDYERGQVGRTRYIVSGGGGAELRTPRCGVPGHRACGPNVAAFINEHHYIDVEVRSSSVRVCPKRPDGTPLEACFTIPGRP